MIASCGVREDESIVNCNIDSGPCMRENGAQQLTVTFDAGPKPISTMKRLNFSVGLKRGDEAVRDADAFLTLSMPGMYMNENRVTLNHSSDGVYTGEGVIPRCTTGKKIWMAEVSVKNPRGQAETPVSASFVFKVSK